MSQGKEPLGACRTIWTLVLHTQSKAAPGIMPRLHRARCCWPKGQRLVLTREVSQCSFHRGHYTDASGHTAALRCPVQNPLPQPGALCRSAPMSPQKHVFPICQVPLVLRVLSVFLLISSAFGNECGYWGDCTWATRALHCRARDICSFLQGPAAWHGGEVGPGHRHLGLRS